MSRDTDSVLKNSRREAIIIGVVWVVSTIYCCAYSYWAGYERPGQKLGPDDVHPIFGMPSWIFWGVIVPWVACSIFIFWFAGFYMSDDDLGKDRTSELEADIREGGLHE